MSLAIANSIDDVLTALAGGARPIAGGTDLVVGARQGKSPLPESLIAIDRVPALSTIEQTDGHVRIGAGVTHSRLMSDPLLVERYTGLADAAALIGSPSTRNVGTIGGNVMNASPAMDTGAPLMTLGAIAELRSVSHTRQLALSDLWTGPGQTSANPDELCVCIVIPQTPAYSGSAYVRLEYRRAMEIAVVGAAASVVLTEDGTIASGRLAMTAVAPTIVELVGASEAMTGMAAVDAADVIASLASDQAVPISDLRGSDRYRRHTIGVMAARALDAAARRAGGERIGVPVNRNLGIGAAR
ncbi:MAG: FAD binding domain-containing protein [Acidimicrobiia bacterium]|nr:FAD binding domain-containing protein [Acidimicrobiia bacterium]MDH5502836.1 FAD binding domain-containing protein [Acidimicrobiia bacterium]